MSDIRYILFKGGLQPKNPMLATEDKIKEIVGAGFRQGKDFDIVSEKVLKDKLGKRGGGMMNMDEMTRPLGYKFGTKDGELVGDRERDLKEWEEDAIDILRRKMDIEKLLKKLPDLLDEKGKEEKRELPDWVEEFIEKNRPDPDRFKNLIPKKEDEGEPFRPEFGPDRFFWPPKDWKNDPRGRGDRFLWPPKNDPRYDRKPFMIPRDKEGNIIPFKQPDPKPFMIPRDEEGNIIPFDPKEGIQLLGDETSSGMHPIVVFKEMYDQYIMDGVPISGEQEPLSFKDFFEIIQIQLDNQASS